MEQSCHFQGLEILTLTDILSNNMEDFEQAHNKNSTQTGGKGVHCGHSRLWLHLLPLQFIPVHVCT